MENEVSILVLMDLSFLPSNEIEDLKIGYEFQSLFLWIFRSYIIRRKYNENNENTFQSLFLWIFRSYQYVDQDKVLDVNEFQSLFLWIFRSYVLIVLNIGKVWSRVSILVLMDLSFLLCNQPDK